MSNAKGIKILSPSESITEKSKVLIDIELKTSRSNFLQNSEPEISKLVILMKPDTMIQKSKGQRNSEPKAFVSKVERKPIPKTSGSKLLKCSETNVKSYPRHNFYKKKVWNKVRHYSKARAHINKRPRVANTKGPIRLWVPKFEVVFIDMLKGKDSTSVLISGQ